MGPVHPDAQLALDKLLGREVTSASSLSSPIELEDPLTEEEIAEAVHEEALAIMEIEDIILEEHDDEEEGVAELSSENIEFLISSSPHEP
jgi:hypothetical protein